MISLFALALVATSPYPTPPTTPASPASPAASAADPDPVDNSCVVEGYRFIEPEDETALKSALIFGRCVVELTTGGVARYEPFVTYFDGEQLARFLEDAGVPEDEDDGNGGTGVVPH
jgi:hypothetical protein